MRPRRSEDHGPKPFRSRREMLLRSAGGFGAVALSALFGAPARGRQDPRYPGAGADFGLPHVQPRCDRVIFLYMDGGPSQVDTWDPKPRLEREHGRPIGLEEVPKTQFDDVGTVLKSPWAFRQYGDSGIWCSDLFPNIAAQADRLCVIRSMTSRFPEHTSANYFLHTGHGVQGRPSMGSWVTYGLGSMNRDLPGFVVLNGGLIPPGGLDNFHNGFLPATFQGSIFQASEEAVANVRPREEDPSWQRAKLDLVGDLDRSWEERAGGGSEIESAIENHELAFRMQQEVPELLDLGRESDATKRLYGLDDAYVHTRTYARMCLLARRLVERGVRFVELTCPDTGHDRWDQHSNLVKGHEDNARAVDRPIAGLLQDLEGRGLLDRTLVVWAGEFGRTPMAQGTTGRDHNPFGFSIWLAGGGIRGGMVYGATDDYGYFAVENTLEIYDLHATMLHLLGVDHTRLTVRFSGRDMRLTDVHGHVVEDILDQVAGGSSTGR